MDTNCLVGIVGVIILYLLGRIIYPDESNHKTSLINYGEAVGQVYGSEEE